MMTSLHAIKQILKVNFLFAAHLFLGISICFSFSDRAIGQSHIVWQKSIGTSFTDYALQLFNDPAGNLIVVGKEPHADFAGNVREYMMITKLDSDGSTLWKTYHDVAFETFSLPVDYYFSDHFYTVEFGDTLLNLILNIHDRTLQYKIIDRTGQYYFYEEITSNVLEVNRENEKIYANVLCSFQQSCYGPDSLVVEKYDPSPDSLIFDPIEWTFEMKQNFRTAPIQGHYDFDIQDIHWAEDGNVYVLVQIERWDFQFCTDCADAFIDAWCEVFKLDANGNLIKNVNLKTAKAVVSQMSFVEGGDGSLLVRINDINANGTQVLTSIYRLDDELNLLKKIDLDNFYHFVQADEELNYYTSTNLNSADHPEGHGLTDILVSKFDFNGQLIWKSNFGGSGWDFTKGFALDENGGIFFLGHSESTDFDVAENLGGQDMWLVKLAEGVSTANENPITALPISVHPNPAADYLLVHTTEKMQIRLYDMAGVEVLRQHIDISNRNLDINRLTPGIYVVRGIDLSGKTYIGKWSKI